MLARRSAWVVPSNPHRNETVLQATPLLSSSENALNAVCRCVIINSSSFYRLDALNAEWRGAAMPTDRFIDFVVILSNFVFVILLWCACHVHCCIASIAWCNSDREFHIFFSGEQQTHSQFMSHRRSRQSVFASHYAAHSVIRFSSSSPTTEQWKMIECQSV